MSPVGLGELLGRLPQNSDPNLLVGFATSDDAAVYRLSADTALVLTADLITPPVDDPYLFGQIAAANALSDVYAMGGRPVACLNLIGFPTARLEPEVLHAIVAGALSKIVEAGAVLAGGHTTEDEEPKFGLSVTGLVHPDRYWSNAGARPGDALVLTKPIGSGVLFNAHRKGKVSDAAMRTCLDTLIALNKAAAEMLRGFDVGGVTDVTGFGLAGHALEMARASDVSLRIEVDRIPVLPEALEMYRRGVTTGVNAANRAHAGPSTRFERRLEGWHEEIVFDPQTSGGLLVATAADRADELVTELRGAGASEARRVGTVEPPDGRYRLVLV